MTYFDWKSRSSESSDRNSETQRIESLLSVSGPFDIVIIINVQKFTSLNLKLNVNEDMYDVRL